MSPKSLRRSPAAVRLHHRDLAKNPPLTRRNPAVLVVPAWQPRFWIRSVLVRRIMAGTSGKPDPGDKRSCLQPEAKATDLDPSRHYHHSVPARPTTAALISTNFIGRIYERNAPVRAALLF